MDESCFKAAESFRLQHLREALDPISLKFFYYLSSKLFKIVS